MTTDRRDHAVTTVTQQRAEVKPDILLGVDLCTPSSSETFVCHRRYRSASSLGGDSFIRSVTSTSESTKKSSALFGGPGETGSDVIVVLSGAEAEQHVHSKSWTGRAPPPLIGQWEETY